MASKKEILDFNAKAIDYLYNNPKLKTIMLEITSRCNAKCEHCGSRCGDFIPKDEIELEYLKKTFKEIAERYENELPDVIITGGEPLVRKDVFEFAKYISDLGFRWGMTTNGMLINDSMIKSFEEAKISSIAISLDGLKETHERFRRVPGSFDKIIKALEKLKKVKSLTRIEITTVANKQNLNELEDMYKFLCEIGIKIWNVVNVDPIGRARDNNDMLLDKEGYEFLFKFIEEKRNEGIMEMSFKCSHYLGFELNNKVRDHQFICIAGLTLGSILSNGDIFVCPDVPRREELIMGNIRKDSFVDVWEKEFKPYRHIYRTVNEKCYKCKEFNYCRGGSFHTWDFDLNEQLLCMKDILR